MKAEYTTLSTKGQIIIPAEIREQMKLAVGTKLSIRRDGQTLILRPITPEFIDSRAARPKVWASCAMPCIGTTRNDDQDRRPMTAYVLDASAILRFSDKEAGFDRVHDLFIRAAQGKVELLLVDAFAGSLASHENATLVTADYDFKSVPSGTIKIEFLPAK